MIVKVHLFKKPDNWKRWVRWAAQWCDSYSQVGQMVGMDRFNVWRTLQEMGVVVEPLGERGWVPVVWTEWGWLEGEFDETGVFRYACDEKKWEG